MCLDCQKKKRVDCTRMVVILVDMVLGVGCFGRIVQGECSVIKSEVCFKRERAYKGEDSEESTEIDEDRKKNERAE